MTICYYFPQDCSKQKKEYHISNINIKNYNESKAIDIKSCICYYFDDIININDLDLNNILLNEKSYKHFWIYDVT